MNRWPSSVSSIAYIVQTLGWSSAAAARASATNADFARGSLVKLAIEPRASRGPFPLHGGRGHLERLGGLLDGHAAEETVLDNARLALVQRGEAPQRLIEREKVVAARCRHRPHIAVEMQ